MGSISKKEFKQRLKGTTTKNIIDVFAYLYTREEMINLILSTSTIKIEKAVWEMLGWKFKIEKE